MIRSTFRVRLKYWGHSGLTSKLLHTRNIFQVGVGPGKVYVRSKQTEHCQETGYVKAGNTIFVHKNAQHRGIEIKNPEELLSGVNGAKKETFAQVYVPNPLLIDGYKFDIGVYVIVSSISPLRVYVYDGDAQFRFCRKKYFPFDRKDVEKYVVGASFRPIWKVSSLSKWYNKLDITKQDVFYAHIRSIGKDPDLIWDKMYDIIRNAFLKHATQLTSAVKEYPYPNSFFELVRFDFILDSNFDVYLMEVNMSPNLSSIHYSKQATMFEQVIYNSLRLVNVARGGIVSDSLKETSAEETKMQVSDKDIAVSSKYFSRSIRRIYLVKHNY